MQAHPRLYSYQLVVEGHGVRPLARPVESLDDVSRTVLQEIPNGSFIQLVAVRTASKLDPFFRKEFVVEVLESEVLDYGRKRSRYCFDRDDDIDADAFMSGLIPLDGGERRQSDSVPSSTRTPERQAVQKAAAHKAWAKRRENTDGRATVAV